MGTFVMHWLTAFDRCGPVSRWFYFFCPAFFLPSPSGKMILNTKKNTTMEMVPMRTVEPMLYSQDGTNSFATATQMQLMEFTTGVMIAQAMKYYRI